MSLTTLIRQDHGYAPYRMKSRFNIPAFPKPEWLDAVAHKAAELFVSAMAQDGWEFKADLNPFGMRMRGPLDSTPEPSTLARPPLLFNPKRDLAKLLNGDPMRLPESHGVTTLAPMAEQEMWEYELSAVFVHKTILTVIPAPHEEHDTIRSTL